jgi:hypothetical protein
LTPKTQQLGNTQASLYRDQQPSVVAPARPSVLIWGGQQGLGFGSTQEVHRPLGEAFAGDRQNPLRYGPEARFPQRDIVEE